MTSLHILATLTIDKAKQARVQFNYATERNDVILLEDKAASSDSSYALPQIWIRTVGEPAYDSSEKKCFPGFPGEYREFTVSEYANWFIKQLNNWSLEEAVKRLDFHLESYLAKNKKTHSLEKFTNSLKDTISAMQEAQAGDKLLRELPDFVPENYSRAQDTLFLWGQTESKKSRSLKNLTNAASILNWYLFTDREEIFNQNTVGGGNFERYAEFVGRYINRPVTSIKEHLRSIGENKDKNPFHALVIEEVYNFLMDSILPSNKKIKLLEALLDIAKENKGKRLTIKEIDRAFRIAKYPKKKK